MFKFNWKIAGIGIAIVLAVVAIIGLILSPDKETTKDQEFVAPIILTVSGSGGTVAILEGVQSQFAEDTPGYQLKVLTGSGTNEGVKGVVEGVLDVVAMARPPKDDEQVEYLEFGKSGQAFVVDSNVEIVGLTSEQAVAIFAGEITNWAEIGGPDLEIIVYVRDEGDSTTKALREGVLGDITFPANAQIMTSQSDMIIAVENTPGAIGMCTWPAAVAMGAKIKMLLLDNASPDDPQYPIINVLGVGYSAERKMHVQPLLDWLVSEEGQAALRDVDVLITP